MSEIAINAYLQEIEKLRHFGGSGNESSLRVAFHKLLANYARSKDLELVAELTIKGKLGTDIRPDGTLKDNLRLDWGYWESKDEYDDLDMEIYKKTAKGYPNDNIVYEDGNTAILLQNGNEVSRVLVTDTKRLDDLLKRFVSYERPEVADFRKAIELFKADVPKVTEALRKSIETNAEQNPAYISARNEFLQLCRDVINPNITPEDIREMVIQHILTADIFSTIFDEPYFHRENNIAKELERLTNTFFNREVRNKTLSGIKHYYDAINAQASRIADHHEKQRFLKVVYETFYKSYNPKKADRLGVVYTPNEIVRFMIESTDYLLQKHFNRMLEDPGVDILDPATGTGTFICDLIDHFSPHKLDHKYRHELHANEVEILPYYIANLNIEFTYKQKTGKYSEFENLCFVDTLDNYMNMNIDGETDIFSLSDENSERIKRQNERKISVIIGNPPYNANQMNENENNKNREYPGIDKRIKDTYIKSSTAQKTKLYDMYARFLRWASDRIDKNGIIAFVSNSSFINSRTFDGFRKVISQEFNHIYVLNMKGNARNSGEQRRREGGNVFHDQIRVGIAIYFLVKKDGATGFDVFYDEVDDYLNSRDKIDYLVQSKISELPFQHIIPDRDHNWIDLEECNWDDLLQICDRERKYNATKKQAVFELFSLGVVTNRDDWVYDHERDYLRSKVTYLIDNYNKAVQFGDNAEDEIKWTRAVKNDLRSRRTYLYNEDNIIECLYRPFTKLLLYYSKELNEMRYLIPSFFPSGRENNPTMAINCSSSKPFSVFAINQVCDLHFLGDTQCFPFYRYSSDGTRMENISDWALDQFQTHYADQSIGKEDIFHYVYAVLHDPAYRKKYEINLKRSLPRVPYYEDFRQWATWGKALMDLHLGFETIEPWDLQRHDVTLELEITPKAKLKADREAGIITLDDCTSLSGIPPIAWQYKLGNRSALEWILDQYKEKKPKDPTIAKLFNNYHFADHKEKVIDLLTRVCTVSVRTMEVIGWMEELGTK